MRNILKAVLLIVLAACSSNPSLTPRPGRDVVTITTAGGSSTQEQINRDDFVDRDEVAATADVVWQMLPEVFVSVGLPVPAVDTSLMAVVVRNHGVMYELGGTKLSHYLECGRNIAGSYADSHRIRLNVRTQLESVGPDRTVIKSHVDGTARAISGDAGTYRCSSRGTLEEAIAEAVRRRIGAMQR